MTASWQLLYTSSLLSASDIQYILKGIQEPSGGWGCGGSWGSGNTTWINRNQTLLVEVFGTLSREMWGGGGVMGVGGGGVGRPRWAAAAVRVPGGDAWTGGMEMWRHGFLSRSQETAAGGEGGATGRPFNTSPPVRVLASVTHTHMFGSRCVSFSRDKTAT